MSHCLSAFAPTKLLYKYLLKYVSDNGQQVINDFLKLKLVNQLLVEKTSNNFNDRNLKKYISTYEIKVNFVQFSNFILSFDNSKFISFEMNNVIYF